MAPAKENELGGGPRGPRGASAGHALLRGVQETPAAGAGHVCEPREREGDCRFSRGLFVRLFETV